MNSWLNSDQFLLLKHFCSSKDKKVRLTSLQVSHPPMSSSDWDLTFTWCLPDVHLTTWPLSDLPLTLCTWHSLVLTWHSPDHLTIIWPSPDPYLTLISSLLAKKVIWWWWVVVGQPITDPISGPSFDFTFHVWPWAWQKTKKLDFFFYFCFSCSKSCYFAC